MRIWIKILSIQKLSFMIKNRKIFYFFIAALTVNCSQNTTLQNNIDQEQAIEILKEAFQTEDELGHFMELFVGGEAIEEFLKKLFNEDIEKIFNKEEISLDLIELQMVLFGTDKFLDRLSEFFSKKYKGLATISTDEKINKFVKLMNENSSNFSGKIRKSKKTQDEINEIVLDGLKAVFELAKNVDGGDIDEESVKNIKDNGQLDEAGQFDESRLVEIEQKIKLDLNSHKNGIFDAYAIAISNDKTFNVTKSLETTFAYKAYTGKNKEILLATILRITNQLMTSIKDRTIEHNLSYNKGGEMVKDLRRSPFKESGKNWDDVDGSTNKITLVDGSTINFDIKNPTDALMLEGFEQLLNKWAIEEVNVKGKNFDEILEDLEDLKFEDIPV